MRGWHLDPGRLRTSLRLEQNASVTDAFGGQMDNWSLVATIWGAIDRIEPTVALRAGDDEQVVDAMITVRSDSRIKPGMRMVAGDQIFQVRALHDPDMTGRYLRCTVTNEKQP